LFFVYKYSLHEHCRQLNTGDFWGGGVADGLSQVAPSSIRKGQTNRTYMGYFAPNNVVTRIYLSFHRSFVHFTCFHCMFVLVSNQNPTLNGLYNAG